MSKHDDLADELLAAGEITFDRAWRLPLWDEYQSLLESSFADVYNIGGRGPARSPRLFPRALHRRPSAGRISTSRAGANDEGEARQATGRRSACCRSGCSTARPSRDRGRAPTST